jgi:hypothetical protein
MCVCVCVCFRTFGRCVHEVSVINPLKPSGNYVPPALTITNSAFCIYVFHMILTVNRDYFLEQR